MFLNPLQLVFRPQDTWRAIASKPADSYSAASIYPIILALIPACAWYYGTTHIGWSIANGDITKLTEESAFRIVCAFYGMMVFSIISIGYSIHWMSMTYGAKSSIGKGIAVAGVAATPLFLAGVIGIYPLLWLDMLVGIIAASWAVYLLYAGIPIIMDIPKEQGFLYSTAIIAVGLVLFIILLVTTVILWQNGFMPVFID